MAYVVQSALGGHSIPSTPARMAVLQRPGPGHREGRRGRAWCRAWSGRFAKNKGVEFGSLLHQLGADFTANPFSPQVRDLLLQIEPEAKSRFPQRRVPRAAKAAEAAAPAKKKTDRKPGAAAPSPRPNRRPSPRPARSRPLRPRRQDRSRPLARGRKRQAGRKQDKPADRRAAGKENRRRGNGSRRRTADARETAAERRIARDGKVRLHRALQTQTA